MENKMLVIILKLAVKLALLPLVPVVIVGDCLLWNITHGFTEKTNIRMSAREVLAAWKNF